MALVEICIPKLSYLIQTLVYIREDVVNEFIC